MGTMADQVEGLVIRSVGEGDTCGNCIMKGYEQEICVKHTRNAPLFSRCAMVLYLSVLYS